MTKEELQNRLAVLLEKEYRFIKEASFATLEEVEQFKKDDETKVLEYSVLLKEKRQIEWDMMTPDEQKEYLEVQEQIRRKHEFD